jgi:hypothetical protein
MYQIVFTSNFIRHLKDSTRSADSPVPAGALPAEPPTEVTAPRSVRTGMAGLGALALAIARRFVGRPATLRASSSSAGACAGACALSCGVD